MIAFFIYLIKVSCCIAAWWLVYWFFFRNEKFYTFNRIYLLIGPAVSFLIPLVKIYYPVEIFIPEPSLSIVSENIQAPVQRFNYDSILLYIYVVCILFLMIRQLFLVLKIRGLIRSGGYTPIDNYRLVDSPDVKIPFSFFNYIFVNSRKVPESENRLILAHERSHIAHHHWIDLVVAETGCIVLWFNPFVWLYLRSMRENHEYLADDAVIRNGYSPAYYRAVLINRSFNTPVFQLANSFTQYKFKRITMMKKETSNPLKKLSAMLLIPAACFFFWAFSEPEYHVTIVESESDVSQEDTVAIQNLLPDSVLYIVDGKEIENLKNISNKDIDSVIVLKDQAATQLYGEKGKNGVIIIATKKEQSSAKPVQTTGKTTKVPPPPTLFRISGTVTDAKDGKPLSGVSIIEKGGKTGTVTDMNGNYSIHVPANSTLRFAFVDMATQEVSVTKSQTINVLMAEDQSQGKIEKNILNISNLTGENRPLYIVDGKEIEKLENVNPKEIESITILKDQVATELYGEKGKNGVIILTTESKK